MDYVREAWLWLGEHANVVMAIVITVGVLGAIALLTRADVTGFVQMLLGR